MSDECEHDWCPGRDFDWEAQMIREHGFFSHMVPFEGPEDGSFGMDNFHTHGFPHSVNHPDIQVVVRLPGKIWSGIAWNAYNRIKDGVKFGQGEEYHDILDNMPVCFAWAEENGRDVLRMILPDKEGKVFEDEINERYAVQWIGTSKKPINGIYEVESWNV